jgi:hypothetical protein
MLSIEKLYSFSVGQAFLRAEIVAIVLKRTRCNIWSCIITYLYFIYGIKYEHYLKIFLTEIFYTK